MTDRTCRLCECGCGRPIPLAKVNHARAGYVKGQQTPALFLRGHHLRVTHPPWWAGDDVGYRALHTWLNKHHPLTGGCEGCGHSGGRTEYALIHGREYTRNPDDYRELCKRCHNAYDQIGGSRWRGVVTAKDRSGPEPCCRCGCGSPAGWDHKHARWRVYAAGHR